MRKSNGLSSIRTVEGGRGSNAFPGKSGAPRHIGVEFPDFSGLDPQVYQRANTAELPRGMSSGKIIDESVGG